MLIYPEDDLAPTFDCICDQPDTRKVVVHQSNQMPVGQTYRIILNIYCPVHHGRLMLGWLTPRQFANKSQPEHEVAVEAVLDEWERVQFKWAEAEVDATPHQPMQVHWRAPSALETLATQLLDAMRPPGQRSSTPA